MQNDVSFVVTRQTCFFLASERQWKAAAQIQTSSLVWDFWRPNIGERGHFHEQIGGNVIEGFKEGLKSL
jgi:hypothetical protein